MPDWSDRVNSLLFDGETVETEVPVGTATVVVTSHRVLAFTPTTDGAEYTAVDRPNVLGVERRSISDRSLWRPAAKTGAIAAPLLLLGIAFDPEAWIPRPDISGTEGTGGAVGTVDALLGVFYAVDVAMLFLGSALGALAIGLVGLQFASRDRYLVLDVAGEESDVRLPDALEAEEVAALRAAVAPPPVDDGDDGTPRDVVERPAE